ncbi:pyridoxal phosphate-dependent aminotransferase [Desulfobacterota bacterium AH_259_B03_O07]|nr:pyridoxal phosphate-dependent aminotransferase [Desulfobacterota bacterium AH_259_B03_O07]
MKLASRAEKLKPSATLLITAKAKALRAEGIDVIGFGAGEPDFDTPENIKDIAVSAINDGFTKYTAVGGIDELKEAIIASLSEDYGLDYDKSEIIVSCGAKHTLYNLTQVIIEEGDEVIIPAPYWVSYPAQVSLAGGKPVIIETTEESGFKIEPDELKEKINQKTKVLILNYPSNPTGATYSEDDLNIIAEIAIDSGLIIISDEIYHKILYDGITHTPIATLGDDVKNSTILVNGVSKTYSMTGWRIGYSAGDKAVTSAMSKLQGQSTSNPVSISQMAAVEALMGSQDDVSKMVREFEERKNYITKRLNEVPDVRCFSPQGAFYVFPNISRFFGKGYDGKEIENSVDFTEFLLEEAKVAVIPGIEFGSDDHVRISYAVSMEDIKKGIDRIEEAVEKLE